MTTTVETCRPGDSLAWAAKLLWDGDCGCALVVEDGERQDAHDALLRMDDGKAPYLVDLNDIARAFAVEKDIPRGEVEAGEVAETLAAVCRSHGKAARAAA